MYNPAFTYFIAQDREEILDVKINDEFGQAAVITILIVPITLAFLWSGTYNIVGQYLLSLLTPGNELLEIILILTSIVTGLLMIQTMNDVSRKLDMSFERVQDMLKEKDSRISELESQLEQIKKNKLSQSL
jgi:hypothetical protein